MKKADERQRFAKSYAWRRVRKSFVSWGEEPLDDSAEMRIAKVAYDARLAETMTSTTGSLIAFVALGAATLTITSAPPWQSTTFVFLAALALFLGLLVCEVAGIRAATQAVSDQRQAVKLTAATAVAPTTPTATASAPQAPHAATKTAVTAGIVAAFAGGVLLTMAARRQRP